jgi:hypothetical protein
MSVADIADEISRILEPDARYRDDSLTRPPYDEIPAGVLYCWPTAEAFETEGQGQLDLEAFVLGVAWATDRGAEAGGPGDRAVSLAIIGRADAVRTKIAANRAGSTFEWLRVAEVDFERVETNTARGFLMRLEGYILRTD